jgi:hypothetical protein
MLDKIRKPHFGVIVPVAVVVILAGSVAAAGAASANRISPGLHNGVHGIVTSVNGNTSTLGACVASDTGTFTMVGAIRQGIVTVNVASTTTYTDAAIVSPATPSFANVCVGGQVEVLGTLSSGALAATAVTIVPTQAQGIVSSVTAGITTSTTEGSCGTAGSPQSFTLVGRGHRAIVTVDVGGGTTFTDAALTPPTLATFADVCVGGQVEVLGTLSSGALAATAVTIVPAQAQGIVSSVTAGITTSTTEGSCGTAGSPQSFTLVGRGHRAIVTVDVGGGTTFTDAALTPPTLVTFADVCVGGQVEVLGTLSSGALAATLVTIVPAQAQGIVASVTVDGGAASSAPGACGTVSEAGSFTLGGAWPIPVPAIASRPVTTVDVGTGTTYTDAAVTKATFANVCVGSQVEALGTLSSGALAATAVTIMPAQAQGIVASVTVDGGAASSAPGACGGADEAGSFTLGSAWPMPVLAIATWPVTTVDVTSSTTFTDAAVVSPATPSFADVCVGGQVEALGTLSSGALAATAVTIVPAQAQGIVASVTVDGGAASSAPGTCGKTGETGSFTLAGITPLPVLAIGSRLVTTVDVTSSTTFTDAAVVSPATPSFADVCVGTNVRAIGTVADGTLTAASVAVLPAVQLPIGHGNRGGHGRS